MSESKVFWLSDQPPTPEDHLAFALERQRERLLDKAHAALEKLPSEWLQEIIQVGENEPS